MQGTNISLVSLSLSPSFLSLSLHISLLLLNFAAIIAPTLGSHLTKSMNGKEWILDSDMAIFCQAMSSESCLEFQNHSIGWWHWKWWCCNRKHLQEHKLSNFPPSTVPEYLPHDMHSSMAYLWIEGKFNFVVALWVIVLPFLVFYPFTCSFFSLQLLKPILSVLVQIGLICYASTELLYIMNCCF